MPSIERFMAEPEAYRDEVLPPSVLVRVTVEAGRTHGWESIAGPFGASVGIDRFGESAPMEVLAEHFGFTAANVAHVAREALAALPAKVAAMRGRIG